MNLENVFIAILAITMMIVLGKWLRGSLAILQKLFLPSSIIAGFLALMLGPQILGYIASLLVGSEHRLAQGLWSKEILQVWSGLPGLLISVVFAALFLGKPIPNLKKIWKQAGPMVAHGQTIAWGQYVVGLLLVVLILEPIWGLSALAGALIEISFEGGHGTAAGLADSFRELGFADGADLALGLATIGVVAGVLLGTALVNWAIWRGHIPRPDEVKAAAKKQAKETPESLDDRVPSSRPIQRDQALDPMSIHIGFVALAIGLGWLILEALVWLEAMLLVPLGWTQLMTHIPLFPLAMIGGVIIQILAVRFGYASRIDRDLMNRISGTALDILIVAAMGTLSLAALGAHAGPLLILAAGGILWNVFGYLVLAPKMFPKEWAAAGLANFGQGMGMTVIGLLLVRMSDPKGRTGTMESFGYKQLLFEPVVGGGLFTAASLPLIAEFGPIPVLIAVSVVMLAWLIFGLKSFGPQK